MITYPIQTIVRVPAGRACWRARWLGGSWRGRGGARARGPGRGRGGARGRRSTTRRGTLPRARTPPRNPSLDITKPQNSDFIMISQLSVQYCTRKFRKIGFHFHTSIEVELKLKKFIPFLLKFTCNVILNDAPSNSKIAITLSTHYATHVAFMSYSFSHRVAGGKLSCNKHLQSLLRVIFYTFILHGFTVQFREFHSEAGEIQ